jgi:small subunit ribosomal protein S11
MAKQMMKKGKAKPKKSIHRNIVSAVAHVKATFNNTIIVIADALGNVIAWSNGGKANFSGSRKSSAFAATVAAQQAGKDAMNMGVKEVDILLKGPGAGRESAVRGLQSVGLRINVITDVTPIQHNGCRAKKQRRV